MIDIFDPGPGARRIGGDIVLQRHGNIDQATRHHFLPDFAGALSGALAQNLVAQHADSVDVEFDRVAALEKAADLQPAAIADRAGTEELAGMDRLVLRGVGENLLEGEQHAARLPARAGFAVDPHLDLQRLRIAEFVGRDDPGSQDIAAVEALALGRAEPALHFHPLPVARGKIVEDRIAEDMRGRLVGGNVRPGPPGHDPDLQFVVHHLAVARPQHRRVRSDDGEAIGDVIDRKLSVDRRHFAERRLQRGAERRLAARRARLQSQHSARRLADVSFKRHRIAHLPRLGQGRQQFDVGERQPQVRLAATLGEQRAQRDRGLRRRRRSAPTSRRRTRPRPRPGAPRRRCRKFEPPRRPRFRSRSSAPSDRLRASPCFLLLPWRNIYDTIFYR